MCIRDSRKAEGTGMLTAGVSYIFGGKKFAKVEDLSLIHILLIIFNKQILLYSCLYHKKDVYLSLIHI